MGMPLNAGQTTALTTGAAALSEAAPATDPDVFLSVHLYQPPEDPAQRCGMDHRGEPPVRDVIHVEAVDEHGQPTYWLPDRAGPAGTVLEYRYSQLPHAGRYTVMLAHIQRQSSTQHAFYVYCISGQCSDFRSCGGSCPWGWCKNQSFLVTKP